MVFNKNNMYIMIVIFISITTISLGYASLNTNLTISGDVVVEAETKIEITGIIFKESLNGGINNSNPSFLNNEINTSFNLPSQNSTVTYTITVNNVTDKNYFFGLIESAINVYPNLAYEIVDKENIIFLNNADTNFDIKFYYKDAVTIVNSFSVSMLFNFSINYIDGILNGADPVLTNGFIPVTITGDGTVYAANIEEEWYNYSNKNWANAVLVKNPDIQYEVGTEIPMNDIKQMYVWIPRYSYDPASIENEYNAIDITFVNDTEPAHPAFTFGTDELKGFWVGKFETGYEFGEDVTSSTLDYSIKPNVYSIGPIDIYLMYQGVIKTNNKYGLDASSDLHVIKNTEWGAVTYITHSIYGICTSDTSCSAVVNNYFQNSSYEIITGCGGSTRPITENVFELDICPSDYRWNTTNGYKASSTKNISGIYDLAAGKYEYVMTFMKNPLGGVYTASSKFTQSNLPDSKYYDLYEENNDSTSSSLALIGDGILEIKDPNATYSWNYDYATFHRTNAPFIVRSGRVGGWQYAGMFAYYSVTGSASGGVGAFSTRNVIAPV